MPAAWSVVLELEVRVEVLRRQLLRPNAAQGEILALDVGHPLPRELQLLPAASSSAPAASCFPGLLLYLLPLLVVDLHRRQPLLAVVLPSVAFLQLLVDLPLVQLVLCVVQHIDWRISAMRRGIREIFNRFPLEKKREKIRLNHHNQMCNQQKKSHISPSTRRYQPSARAESPPATKLVAVMSSKYITVDETQATSLAEAKILATQHEGLCTGRCIAKPRAPSPRAPLSSSATPT